MKYSCTSLHAFSMRYGGTLDGLFSVTWIEPATRERARVQTGVELKPSHNRWLCSSQAAGEGRGGCEAACAACAHPGARQGQAHRTGPQSR
jgi:hypothetical protein